MNEQEENISNSLNFDGGDSGGGGIDFPGGNSTYAQSPLQGSPTGGLFITKYTNIAQTQAQFPRVNATFRDFNIQPALRFSEEKIKVTQRAETLDFLNLVSFFHPIQSFSEFQKQTFVINPRSTINLDPFSFTTTNGEVSLIMARAYYLPEATPESMLLFWDYQGNDRNVMGQIMVLSGSVKNSSAWEGWDLNPFTDVNHTDPANISLGGLSFTNPTDLNVKLSILVSS